jgi:hypothetical protein
MYMNSHERRIAILLRQIPGADRDGDIDVCIGVWDRVSCEGGNSARPLQLVRVDEERQFLVFDVPDYLQGRAGACAVHLRSRPMARSADRRVEHEHRRPRVRWLTFL